MKAPFLRLLGVAVLLGLALPLHAQTTGSIRGTVETGGTPLPGVTVEAKSPNLQGSRSGGHRRGGPLQSHAPASGRVHGHGDARRVRAEGADAPALAGPGRGPAARAPAGAGRGDHRHRAGRHRRDRVEHGRPNHGRGILPGASHRAQLRLGRAARERHQHGHVGRAPDVDHRLRFDGPRERLHGGRRQHDRRRDRQPGQGHELRVHPGSRDQGRRLRGRVHRRPGRNPQRRHQVRRQRVPRRRLRLLGRRRPPGGEQAPRRDRGRGRPVRLHALGLRRRRRRLHPEGSPLVLRSLRPREEHGPAPGHAGDRPPARSRIWTPRATSSRAS